MPTAEIINLQSSFKQAADTYELRMGQVTRSVAHHISAALQLPPESRICDNACGTGAVFQSILDVNSEVQIDACDIAEPMTKIAEAVSKDHGWSDKVRFQVANSIKLPYSDGVFDANIMNFGIFFTPDPQQTAREIYRTTKSGGKAIVTCWKDSAFFRLNFAIQDAVNPVKKLEGLPMFDRWKNPEMIKSVMRNAGFGDIKLESVPVYATLETHEQLMQYCVMNIAPIVDQQWTAEEKAMLPAATAKVLASEGNRYFETDTAGVTHFPWVAWVATATK